MMTDKELLERALAEVAPLNPTAAELVRRFADDIAAEDAFLDEWQPELFEKFTRELQTKLKSLSPHNEVREDLEGLTRRVLLNLACHNQAHGKALSPEEIEVLVAIGRLVVQNVDPRPLYCDPQTAGRPATTPSEWIALDVLLRGKPTKATRGAVAERWRLGDETVRGIARQWRARAQSLLEILGEDGARIAVAERHRLHMRQPGVDLFTAATLGDAGANRVLDRLGSRSARTRE